MQVHSHLLVALSLALLVPGVVSAQTTSRDEEAALAFFEKKIRPLLAENCYNCHSANTNSRGGLRVDDRNGLIFGGDRGPAIVPGHPEKSLLLQAVRQTGKTVKMPPSKQLSAQQIADLTQWIKDGAAWPQVKLPGSVGRYAEKYASLRKQHWAWQPLRDVPIPGVHDATWARDDIDRFLLAKLEEKGLKPVADVDPVTLIRRLNFDLTGLPPAPPEIAAFMQSASRNRESAIAEVVDRLLASSAFGEHWGRHWLDLARYGESTGSSRNVPYPHAWRYRDYVINAFNSDRPYDQFLREQIAGDLLPAKSQQQRDEQLIATGFLAIGVRDVNQRFKVRFIMDNIDEQIDTLSRSVLALTASCARCHDHKFDPIPTADYYALAGIFNSTELCAGVKNKMGGGGMDYYVPALLLRVGGDTPAVPPAKLAQAKKAFEAAKAAYEAIRGTQEGQAVGADGKQKQVTLRQKMLQQQNELLALTDPAAHGRAALGLREGKTIGDTEIRIRGEAEKLGPVVPRGFLSLVEVPDAPKVNPQQSGRLELAQWLTNPKNPLPARVMVNRIWHYLFGQGLVLSVDNFGTTGDTPVHPELLDHLATRFIREGWSVKKLVRAIVLTRAYQLGSETSSTHLTTDPANRLIWRHVPRRLTAEEIRDAMLTAAGKLDRSPPVASAAKDMKVMELTNNSAEAKRLIDAANSSLHRSVYLPLVRGITPTALEVFDFAEQGLVTGSRDATTVAPQALYLLNDPFVRQQAQSLAVRVLGRKDLDDTGRIQLAYRLTLGREATTKESERVVSYLADYEAAIRQGSAKQPTAPRTAAWASFCQALLGSAEFRYLR